VLNQSIKIREANSFDSIDIWNWRNDVSTRANSLNQAFIDWESHQEWFRDAIVSQKNFFYIGLLLEEKIGVCRFSGLENGQDFEVSINLNPRFRGKHLSREFLNRCMKEIFSTEVSPHSLIAIVRETNLPSAKLFNSLGFKLIDSIDGVAEFRFTKLDTIEVE
jgi:RimJ/RimL family protein N-acetyltransferase